MIRIRYDRVRHGIASSGSKCEGPTRGRWQIGIQLGNDGNRVPAFLFTRLLNHSVQIVDVKTGKELGVREPGEVFHQWR